MEGSTRTSDHQFIGVIVAFTKINTHSSRYSGDGLVRVEDVTRWSHFLWMAPDNNAKVYAALRCVVFMTNEQTLCAC